LVTYWLYPNDTYPKYDEKWLRIIRQPFVKQPIVSGLVMHLNDNYPNGLGLDIHSEGNQPNIFARNLATAGNNTIVWLEFMSKSDFLDAID